MAFRPHLSPRPRVGESAREKIPHRIRQIDRLHLSKNSAPIAHLPWTGRGGRRDEAGGTIGAGSTSGLGGGAEPAGSRTALWERAADWSNLRACARFAIKLGPESGGGAKPRNTATYRLRFEWVRGCLPGSRVAIATSRAFATWLFKLKGPERVRRALRFFGRLFCRKS
jgi:hypothetical protein